MNEPKRVSLTPAALAGMVLIILGVLFMLDNFGLFDAGDLFDWWPLFMIFPGMARLAQPRKSGDRLWGGILVGVGLFFLLRNLGVFWVSIGSVWPIGLLLLGLYLIRQASRNRRLAESGEPRGTASPSGQLTADGEIVGLATGRRYDAATYFNTLDELALFGGGDRALRSDDFRGGSVVAVFGGLDIDLRECVIAGDTVTIDVTVVFGGVDLRVPESWNVQLRGTPILGSTEFKPRRAAPPDSETPVKTLVVTGVIIFGGLEVKN